MFRRFIEQINNVIIQTEALNNEIMFKQCRFRNYTDEKTQNCRITSRKDESFVELMKLFCRGAMTINETTELKLVGAKQKKKQLEIRWYPITITICPSLPTYRRTPYVHTCMREENKHQADIHCIKSSAVGGVQLLRNADVFGTAIYFVNLQVREARGLRNQCSLYFLATSNRNQESI